MNVKYLLLLTALVGILLPGYVINASDEYLNRPAVRVAGAADGSVWESDTKSARSRAAELEEVLARVRTAIGYEHIGAGGKHIAIRSSSRDAGGYKSEITTTFAPDGRFVQHVRAPIEHTSGYDGKTAWRVMWGVGTVLSLSSREFTLTGIWLRTGYWLNPDAPLLLSLKPSDEREGVLHIDMKLKDGLIAWRIEIDRETWLPRSAATQRMGRALVVELEDYVDHVGWKVPHRVSVRVLDKLVRESETHSVRVAKSSGDEQYKPRLDPPRDTRFDPTKPGKLEVKRALYGTRLLIHPLINGKDVGWFLFDTGAGGWIITRDAARKAGLKALSEAPSTSTAGLAVTLDVCRAESVQLGPATFSNQIIRAVDLAESGSERAGLIGHGLLARCVLEYDDEAAAIWIHDPEHYEPKGGVWQEMVPGERVPTIEAICEGHTALYRVDTGSNSSLVFNSPYVERLDLLDGRQTRAIEALGGDGRLMVERGKVAWFELAGHRFTDVEADFATLRMGVLADPYTAGLICNDLLRPFKVVLDYPRNRIAFVPKTTE